MKSGAEDLQGIPDKTLDETQRDGRKRLYSSLTNPNWLVLRKRRQIFSAWLNEVQLNDAIVLDVGGRIQPYRSLLERPKATSQEIAAGGLRYIAVDLVVTPLVNVVADATTLPFSSTFFDLVLCTQMLEYIPDPQQAIAEIYRVLKPGGFLLLSTPAVYIQDSENDRWRFLPGALSWLLRDFSKTEIAPEGSSLIGFVRTINVCLMELAKATGLRWLIQYSLIPVFNLAGLAMENLLTTTNTSFTANFSVLAKK